MVGSSRPSLSCEESGSELTWNLQYDSYMQFRSGWDYGF